MTTDLSNEEFFIPTSNGGAEEETPNLAIPEGEPKSIEGVSREGGKWVAELTVNNTRMLLYRGDSEQEAIEARQAAVEKYGLSK